MIQYTDKAITTGILQKDNNVLEYVYQKMFQQIKYLVISNSGNEEEAKDVFQEAMIIIYNKLANDELELVCAFKTYLYSVCRLLWLKQLEKRRIKGEDSYDENLVNTQIQEGDIIEDYERNDRYSLYQKHFKRLSEDCQKVLQLFLEKISLREIAEIMGYSSEKYAKKRKYICKESLVQNIQKDPQYKELL